MRRYSFCFLTAFFLSCLFCYLLIPVLRKLKAGQNILSYVKEHKGKSGTPTMGGLAFVFAAVLTTVLFYKKWDRTLVVTLTVGVSYLCVGFLDDLFKKRRKENLGLKAWQKIVFQTFVAVFAGVYCVRSGYTKIYLPFFGGTLDFGKWTAVFCVFVFLSTVNCVNLTDGLDGLASAVSLPFFLALGVILCMQQNNPSLPILCFSFGGALGGYLLFNSSPASVFMGDTGSLALGGFISCVALFSGNALFIPVIGAAFVLSGVTVILQVLYFKATKGKRIFLMAPVHHHFQQKGYSETKISYAYAVATTVLGVLSIVCML